jgi:hypothetical protein
MQCMSIGESHQPMNTWDGYERNSWGERADIALLLGHRFATPQDICLIGKAANRWSSSTFIYNVLHRANFSERTNFH